MAFLFMLGAECGPKRDDALAVALHFAGLRWVLSDGLVSETLPGTEWQWAIQDECGNWWANVVPSGMSTSGGGNEAETRRMNEVALHLYERLRTSPPLYRFASVGVEALHFTTAEGLRDLAKAGHPLPGLVLNRALWEQSGRPAVFQPFAPGYYWQPFRGVE